MDKKMSMLAPKMEQVAEVTQEKVRPREKDLFNRTFVAAGEAALNHPEMGPQILQLAQAGSTPVNGIATALSVLLGEARNQAVAQGKGVPVDLLFMPKGAAEVLAYDIAEEIGASPKDALAAVPQAQQMMMQTDEQAQQAGAQPQGGGGAGGMMAPQGQPMAAPGASAQGSNPLMGGM